MPPIVKKPAKDETPENPEQEQQQSPLAEKPVSKVSFPDPKESVSHKSAWVNDKNACLAKTLYAAFVQEEISGIRVENPAAIATAINTAARKTERVVKGFVDNFGNI